MDEGIKILVTDVLDVLENVEEYYYKHYRIEQTISDRDFEVVLAVLYMISNQLEDLAEETYETDTDITAI